MRPVIEDLVTFLNARLDEDEAAAKAATVGPWEFEGDDPTDDEIYSVHDGIADLVGVAVAFTRDRQVANGQHMARHDPARTLREVEAKRAIIAEAGRIAQSASMYPNQGNAAALIAMQTVLKILAAEDRDHPDYRQEWLA